MVVRELLLIYIVILISMFGLLKNSPSFILFLGTDSNLARTEVHLSNRAKTSFNRALGLKPNRRSSVVKKDKIEYRDIVLDLLSNHFLSRYKARYQNSEWNVKPNDNYLSIPIVGGGGEYKYIGGTTNVPRSI